MSIFQGWLSYVRHISLLIVWYNNLRFKASVYLHRLKLHEWKTFQDVLPRVRHAFLSSCTYQFNHGITASENFWTNFTQSYLSTYFYFNLSKGIRFYAAFLRRSIIYYKERNTDRIETSFNISIGDWQTKKMLEELIYIIDTKHNKNTIIRHDLINRRNDGPQ